MTVSEFWAIIDAARAGSVSDNAFNAELRTRLTRLSPEEDAQFRRRLGERLAESYRWDLWGVAHVLLGGCGDDAFDAFRAWLVSQGRETYERVLASPVSLRMVRADRMENEALLALADCAGQPQQPAGTPWQEEDLHTRFPELFPDDAPAKKLRRLTPADLARMEEVLAWGRERLALAARPLPPRGAILAAFPGARHLVEVSSPAHVGFAAAWLVAPGEVDRGTPLAAQVGPLLEDALGPRALVTPHEYLGAALCDDAVESLNRVVTDRLAAGVQERVARTLISPLRAEGERRHHALLAACRAYYDRHDVPFVPFQHNVRLVNVAAAARFLRVATPVGPIVDLDIGPWCLVSDVVVASPLQELDGALSL